MELDSNWYDFGTPTVNERTIEQVYQGTYARKFSVDDYDEGIQSETFTTVTGELYRLSFWFIVYHSGCIHLIKQTYGYTVQLVMVVRYMAPDGQADQVRGTLLHFGLKRMQVVIRL
jgi:hypothetical protein